jgi:hypothetical protein
MGEWGKVGGEVKGSGGLGWGIAWIEVGWGGVGWGGVGWGGVYLRS